MLFVTACSAGRPAATNTIETDAGDTVAENTAAEDPVSEDTVAKDPASGTAESSGDIAPVTQLTTPGCSATSDADGVNVAWWGLSSDAEIEILGQGRVLAQTEAKADGVLTLFGAAPEPGNPIQLIARTTDDATIMLECGTGGTLTNLPIPDCALDKDLVETSDSPDPEPAIGDCDSTTIPEADETPALVAAKDLFTSTAFGPHAYFTIVSLGESRDLYMQADGSGSRTFVPPLDNSELINPFTVHDELAEAITSGRDVEYQLDESSGLPTRWTVDHQTIQLRCFELDTAPPELRVGPCDPETDFIGR